jgi:hypothetical protein
MHILSVCMLDYFRRFCQFIPEKHAQKSTTHWDMMNDQTFFMIQIKFFHAQGVQLGQLLNGNIAVQTLQFHRGDIGLHQEKMRCLPK